MYTCIDVAKKANVSRATVTRVLREPDKVAKDTREKVLKVMKELNYSGNYLASSLKSARTRTIGLIIPDIINPFYIEFAHKLQQRLLKLNYNLIIQLSNESIQEENNSIDFLLRCKVECLLFSPLEANENIQTNYEYYNNYMLQLFRDTYKELSSINVDDEVGGYIATKRLLDAGYQDIVLFEGVTPDMISSRLQGYKRAFEEVNLPYNENNYVSINIFDTNKDKMQEIIQQKQIKISNNKTAFIVVAYKLQEMFINIVNSLGLKMKDDYSAIFYDKTFFSQTYNVTTITHDIDNIVNNVIKQILLRIEQNDKTLVKIQTLPYLFEGDSIKKQN